jgi:hypothetical protein
MSSNAVKRLSFALSTAAKNLVFEALSGNSKAASIIRLLVSNIIFLAFCFPLLAPQLSYVALSLNNDYVEIALFVEVTV